MITSLPSSTSSFSSPSLKEEADHGLYSAQVKKLFSLLQALEKSLPPSFQKSTEMAQISYILQELGALDERRKRFACICCHELKEPLRTIASFTQLLATYHSYSLEPCAKEYLDFILKGVDRMKVLIQDILNYSQASAHLTHTRFVDMEEALASAQAGLLTAIQEAKATISSSPLPSVEGHPTLIIQLLQNLLSNALKFKRKNPVLIEIGAKEKGKFIEFYVKDNGIGIAPEYHSKIFEIFERLHTKSDYKGTGIGLALCKKIVEQGGGKIWVESKLKKGATFYFTLPKSSLLKKTS